MTDKKLPTVDIHGKEYVLVKDRILAFHEAYADKTVSINTEITITGDSVLAKTTVTTPKGTYTGHSEAIRSTSRGITGQSPVEVAETSAVGRALGMLGIGILESVASADEIRKAPVVAENAPTDPNAPKCDHGPMKLNTTKKAGANFGRQFYSCPQPMGKQCEGSFVWADEYAAKSLPNEQVIDEDGDVVVVSSSDLPF